MGTQYSHLTLEERCRLRGLMEIGLGVSEISRRLGRHRGTIHREVGRNRRIADYRPQASGCRPMADLIRSGRECTQMTPSRRSRGCRGYSRPRVADSVYLVGELCFMRNASTAAIVSGRRFSMPSYGRPRAGASSGYFCFLCMWRWTMRTNSAPQIGRASCRERV